MKKEEEERERERRGDIERGAWDECDFVVVNVFYHCDLVSHATDFVCVRYMLLL